MSCVSVMQRLLLSLSYTHTIIIWLLPFTCHHSTSYHALVTSQAGDICLSRYKIPT